MKNWDSPLYALYLDASGDSGQYTGINTQYFVLTGLACQPKDWFSLSSKIAKIIDLYFKPPVTKPCKLRYYELIHKKYPFNQIDCKKFADDIFKVITESDLILFAMTINKKALWAQYSSPAPPHELALEFMAERFQWFLERKNDIGMIVHDREPSGISNSLLGLFERCKRKGTSYKKIDNIIDTIFFSPSETSVPLQLADFCAYAVLSKYEHNKPDRFGQIREKFNSHGMKEFP